MSIFVTYCSNYCEYNKAKREKYQVFNVNRDFHSNVLQRYADMSRLFTDK
jgi:hypothetical protein